MTNLSEMTNAHDDADELAEGLELTLDAGVTYANNMGCGIVVVDQYDEFTDKLQRVVLTKAELLAILAWMD